MSELTSRRATSEDVTLLYPSGFINAHTVRALRGRAPEGVWQRRFKIVVNCAGPALHRERGPGRASWARSRRSAATAGTSAWPSLNETVRNIFEILGFNHLYRIFPSELEAIAELPPGRAPAAVSAADA